MTNEDAVINLFSLAHPGRLSVFRTLVEAGPEGLAAGRIAKTLSIPANTASTHLSILTGAGLLKAFRDGRSIIYSVNFDQMTSLVTFLINDCCIGEKSVCYAVQDALEETLNSEKDSDKAVTA